MDSKDIEMHEVDISQKEKTLERSDKGKILVVQDPSSSKGKYFMDDTSFSFALGFLCIFNFFLYLQLFTYGFSSWNL